MSVAELLPWDPRTVAAERGPYPRLSDICRAGQGDRTLHAVVLPAPSDKTQLPHAKDNLQPVLPAPSTRERLRDHSEPEKQQYSEATNSPAA